MKRRPGPSPAASTPVRRSVVVGGCALAFVAAWPFNAAAQAAGKVYRIGYLANVSVARNEHEFVQGLHEAGWGAGRNISIEFRFGEGRPERLPALAAELVGLKVDLIVAHGTPAAVAAKNATSKVPIVIANVGDPVRQGLIASLARPGGNITGTAFDPGLQTIVKSLQLLAEAVPDRRHVAVMTNPANPLAEDLLTELNAAARLLGLRLSHFPIRGPDEFDRAFVEMKKERVEALQFVPESLFLRNRVRLAELAIQHRLPTMHGMRENVDSGGLMSYGPSLGQGVRRAATFVDRILRGARPRDLPVEQPTRFELRVNLKTAKALGVTISPVVMLRVDEVIE
jgi:putative tryptophan/tyrosine transport system substrate-binding protein